MTEVEDEVVNPETGEVKGDGSGLTAGLEDVSEAAPAGAEPKAVPELSHIIELERFEREVREFCRESPTWRKFSEILKEKMDECEFKWLDPDSKPGDLKAAQLQLLAYRSIETILVDTVSREAREAREAWNEERRRHPLLHNKEASEGDGKKRRGRKGKSGDAEAGAGDGAVEPRNESEKSEESEGGVLQMKQEGSKVTFFEEDPPREPRPPRKRTSRKAPVELGYVP
ncbi:MAG: hypothetical protein GHCLOJNM_03041 [bacterium]|nr:hypothetical protein [bacterium]